MVLEEENPVSPQNQSSSREFTGQLSGERRAFLMILPKGGDTPELDDQVPPSLPGLTDLIGAGSLVECTVATLNSTWVSVRGPALCPSRHLLVQVRATSIAWGLTGHGTQRDLRALPPTSLDLSLLTCDSFRAWGELERGGVVFPELRSPDSLGAGAERGEGAGI